MTVQIFLTLAGIQGESSTIPNAIDIFSASFGATNSSTVIVTGGGSGKVTLSSVALQMAVSSASAPLYVYCAKGTHIASGTLTFRRAGTQPFPFLVVAMTGIIVSSISDGVASGSETASESVSLSYTTINYTYSVQKPDGSVGPKSVFTWNVPGNHA